MTLRSDNASAEVPANGTPPSSAPSGRGLREQAIEAFGILQRRADREIAPERLRAFLQSQAVTPATLFGLLAEFARAKEIGRASCRERV
jgi:hypothetical protein